MIEKERQVWIMEKIRRNGFVSVKELMGDLEISRSSVMRDLIALEKNGLLVREHGGASLPEISEVLSRKKEAAVFEKETVFAEEKKRIAKAASEQMRPGGVFFIDSGTTAACLADCVRDREVNVVTPSVFFIRRLGTNPKCTVSLLGGQYDSKYDMNTGEYAMEMLGYYRFDAAFLSASAMDLETGDVMAADFSLSVMKKAVMGRSGRNFLLIDASKIGKRAACPFAKGRDFSTIYISETKQTDLLENMLIVKEK